MARSIFVSCEAYNDKILKLESPLRLCWKSVMAQANFAKLLTILRTEKGDHEFDESLSEFCLHHFHRSTFLITEITHDCCA